MSSFHQRALLKRSLKNNIYSKKIKPNGPFDIEELIHFLRRYFQDNNIYFYEATRFQNAIKNIRLKFDVGDGDRLSKIEGIDFYESVRSNTDSGIVTGNNLTMVILDRDLVNETINCIVEDLRYYFPLISPISTGDDGKVFISRTLVWLLHKGPLYQCE